MQSDVHLMFLVSNPNQSNTAVLHAHRHCIINSVWCLKQHTLQVNGHSHELRRAVRNGTQAKTPKREKIHFELVSFCAAFTSWYKMRFKVLHKFWNMNITQYKHVA